MLGHLEYEQRRLDRRIGSGDRVYGLDAGVQAASCDKADNLFIANSSPAYPWSA